MEYGLQLFSVRDAAAQDFDATLSQVAKQGYAFVETAGFHKKTAEEFNEMMAKYGLRLIATHTGLKELVQDYEGTVAYHKAIKNPRYVIPGHDLSSQEKIDDFVEKVNYYQPKLEGEGITLAFHNHYAEFQANPDGSVPMEQILLRTNLKLEVDTFWAYYGLKTNPIPFLERISDRLILVHIKDGFSDGHGKPLGQGEAPVAEVCRWVMEHGIPMVVESETQDPDGLTESAICSEYLKNLN